MNSNAYVIGIDFGTDSVRALVVNAANGDEIATSVVVYPRWSEGKYCDPAKNRYRQHPLDYLDGLEKVVHDVLEKIGSGAICNIRAISFDTTASTPVLLDSCGTPLALLPEYSEDPDAMFILWKDHTAIGVAAEINELAHRWPTDYTTYSGGIYSSEWAWSKVLHVLRVNPSLREKAYSWAEHCDWISGVLTGNTTPETMIRGRCAAGHKAMWHESWGGLPSQEFLSALDPLLDGMRERLYTETYTNDKCIGTITPEWSRRLGLPTDTVIGLGVIDCHSGAIGVQIKPNVLVKTIGTSTCDILTAGYESLDGRIIGGICGQVDGSVMPGFLGLEAGQSAFGDIYAWFKNLLLWPYRNIKGEAADFEDDILPYLTEYAARIDPAESSVIALDWMNGRRTPDANPLVKGVIFGITLGTTAPAIFRALVEATAFGSRVINERFIESGVVIEDVIAIGGIARKSPFVMQIMADVMGAPIKVAQSTQACALGAAMCAAVAGGIYNNLEDAQSKMGRGFDSVYTPDAERHEIYNGIHERYLELSRFFDQF